MQRDPAEGVAYCQRKVMLLGRKMEQLSALMKQRQAILSQAVMTLEEKVGGVHGRPASVRA